MKPTRLNWPFLICWLVVVPVVSIPAWVIFIRAIIAAAGALWGRL